MTGNTHSFVLITGSTSGLGREIAIHLSRQHCVIVHGRDRSRAADTVSQLHGSGHLTWIYDLNDVGNIRSDLASFLRTGGVGVNHYVHCAGFVSPRLHRATPTDVIRRTFDVNVLSALEVVATVSSRKINNKRLESIVFISSIWGQYGAPGHVAYGASKSALEGATRALAVELAPNTRVNAIAAGAFDSPMSARALANPSVRKAIEQDYPLGIGQPAAIVDATSFLLSDKASWLTGQIVAVDGGRTSHMSYPSQLDTRG